MRCGVVCSVELICGVCNVMVICGLVYNVGVICGLCVMCR